MKFGCLLLMCTGALIAFTPAAAEQSGDLPLFLTEQIDVLVEREMSQQAIPGVSLAIAAGKRVQFARGYGMADLENSVPVTSSTVFRTASIAKPMTATAVMSLVEKGSVDLDASIQTYCSEFPEKRWRTTVGQLLGHLGGIRHYLNPGEESATAHFFSVRDALRAFKNDPLVHEPGTAFLYTTYGYTLLGCAVEGVSGQSFEEFMSQTVFDPALMVQTRTDDHYALINRRARGYLRVDPEDVERLPEHLRKRVRVGQVLNAPLHDTSVKVPGGGLVSSSPDLVRFAVALQDGVLLKRETVERMWVSQAGSEGTPTGYGLGWKIDEDRGERIISHSGRQAGVRTHLAILPERGVVVAVMCNLQNASLEGMVGNIFRLLAQPVTEVDD